MTGALPVVLVKGEDPVLLADAVRDAVEDALDGDDRELATEDLGGDDLTVGAVIDAAMTPPFLTARRVLVVRDVGRWASDALEPLLDYLAAPLDSTSLVLVAGGGQTSTAPGQRRQEGGPRHRRGCARAGKARTAWVIDRLKASPLRFDAAAGAAPRRSPRRGSRPPVVDRRRARERVRRRGAHRRR